jgi:hypothetical protein
MTKMHHLLLTILSLFFDKKEKQTISGGWINIYPIIHKQYQNKLHDTREYGGLIINDNIIENAIWDGNNINFPEEDIKNNNHIYIPNSGIPTQFANFDGNHHLV